MYYFGDLNVLIFLYGESSLLCNMKNIVNKLSGTNTMAYFLVSIIPDLAQVFHVTLYNKCANGM